MRANSNAKDKYIGPGPSMFTPYFRRGNEIPVKYSRRDIIIGTSLAIAFIVFMIWFIGNYFYAGWGMGASEPTLFFTGSHIILLAMAVLGCLLMLYIIYNLILYILENK